MLKAWLGALLRWTFGGAKEGSQKLVVLPLKGPMTVRDVTNQLNSFVGAMVPDEESPRLKTWLETSAQNVTYTPWSLFQYD
jgi:hypothetical protein